MVDAIGLLRAALYQDWRPDAAATGNRRDRRRAGHHAADPVFRSRGADLLVPPQAAPPGELTAILSLHAEHAELGRRGNRRVQRGGYAERQRVAGFDGIEHAVVP
jgi:hypothetical protein